MNFRYFGIVIAFTLTLFVYNVMAKDILEIAQDAPTVVEEISIQSDAPGQNVMEISEDTTIEISEVSIIDNNVNRKSTAIVEAEARIEEQKIIEESKPKTIYMGNFKLTAYCSCKKCCGRWSPEVTGKASFTESGTNPKQGRTVAVDKRVIPLGTKILIDGKEYIAEDTGSAVKGNHIDIYFDSHKEAYRFGTQRGEVEIVVE